MDDGIRFWTDHSTVYTRHTNVFEIVSEITKDKIVENTSSIRELSITKATLINL